MYISDEIHVAIAPWDLTDDYNKYACVTLLSLLDHCTRPVTIHLLYDKTRCIGKEKETEYSKSCYKEIADNYNCTLLFHHVDLPLWIHEMPSIKHWTPGTLLRLCLPEILPNVDKILYLDCDFVVLTDVSVLWKFDLSPYYLAACFEDLMLECPNNKQRFKYYSENNIKIDKYFNAGFLLLNLKKLRDTEFTSKIFDFMHSHLDLPALDQDAFNWFCQGAYLRLEKKYDVMNWLDNPSEYNGDCNIHYGIKPWKAYHGLNDIPYWEYLQKTPWCKDYSYFLSLIHMALDYEKAIHILPKNLLANISGTPIEKAKKVLKFIFSIIVSSMKAFINRG